jgi:8-oxo-dGTP pyrophosphatase MutT (NUDIX family)
MATAMKAARISLESAKKDKLFYFVANTVVYDPGLEKCLILKRSVEAKVHPGKYCVPGGKLEWADLDLSRPSRLNGEVLDFENTVERLLEREVLEETGLMIDGPLHYLNSVAFVRPDGIPVVLVKFACVCLPGKVRLEPEAFSDYAWVDSAEVEQYDCILGVPQEVKQCENFFKKRRKK